MTTTALARQPLARQKKRSVLPARVNRPKARTLLPRANPSKARASQPKANQSRANRSRAREHQLRVSVLPAKVPLPRAKERQVKVNVLPAKVLLPRAKERQVKVNVLPAKVLLPRERQVKAGAPLGRGYQRKGNVHQGHLKHQLIQKLQMDKRSTLKQALLPGRVAQKNSTLLKQRTSRP